MRSVITILILLFTSKFSIGQNTNLDAMMSIYVPTSKDIGYNFALHLPRLYYEGKTDSINLMINYCYNEVGNLPLIVPYTILNSIKERKFKEELRNVDLTNKDKETDLYTDAEYYKHNIFPYYMIWYRDNFSISIDYSYELNIRKTYGAYFGLIVSIAKELKNIKDLSALEKWYLDYFSLPDYEKPKLLDNELYNNTLLQLSWKKYKEGEHKKETTLINIYSGIWVPNGALAILGNHPYIGYNLGGKWNRTQFDFGMDIRFLRSPKESEIRIGNSIFNSSYFLGLNLGANMGYSLVNKGKNDFLFTAGLAWEFMSLLSPKTITDYDLNQNAGSFNTLNINGGFCYRFVFHRRISKNLYHARYIGFSPKYNFLFFNNNSQPDLRGSAVTITIQYGGLSKNLSRHQIEK